MSALSRGYSSSEIAHKATIARLTLSRLVAVRGPNLKELYLADCERLTDVSVKAIAASCSELRFLDLVNLTKLTDSSVRYLANGCRFLQKFRLCCNIFRFVLDGNMNKGYMSVGEELQ
ncbi:hypothetical protein GIB67_011415 [Kingdonia uniflora]|uniref:Uncharacterized protein n=1 Tax=Kingdonia uniflora TaxID=39325 RepID=A0A7J7NLY6_9MAGN|nr:hypothetical protein GIB67_011415 [Kingdonia uniflora]